MSRVVVRGVWSGASLPSQRVIACACGPDSASSRDTPVAISSAAHESSVVSPTGSPSSGNQYARLSPTLPATSSPCSRIAATNVQDAGFGLSGLVLSSTASLAASAATLSRAASAPARDDSVPRPWACPATSTSRAARAAASEATSESSDELTPSQTTSSARLPGSASAPSAMASSFRLCRMPRSHTPATHGAGCSAKWSRGFAALVPQVSQYPSAPTVPPQDAQGPTGPALGLPAGSISTVGSVSVLNAGVAGVAAPGLSSAPQAPQNRSASAPGPPQLGQAVLVVLVIATSILEPRWPGRPGRSVPAGSGPGRPATGRWPRGRP